MAASWISAFLPFGIRTIIESTFSDRYFSVARALEGVIPLYFPILKLYHKRIRRTKIEQYNLTYVTYTDILLVGYETHTYMHH